MQDRCPLSEASPGYMRNLLPSASRAYLSRLCTVVYVVLSLLAVICSFFVVPEVPPACLDENNVAVGVSIFGRILSDVGAPNDSRSART